MLIGRLATDPGLRRRFEDGPSAIVHELVATGYELSPVEMDALAVIDRESLRTFAGRLDPRLRRVDNDNRPTSSRR